MTPKSKSSAEEFEEGRSRRSRVFIDRGRKGYRWTDKQTDRQQYALSSSKGGIKTQTGQHYIIPHNTICA